MSSPPSPFATGPSLPPPMGGTKWPGGARRAVLGAIVVAVLVAVAAVVLVVHAGSQTDDAKQELSDVQQRLARVTRTTPSDDTADTTADSTASTPGSAPSAGSLGPNPQLIATESSLAAAQQQVQTQQQTIDSQTATITSLNTALQGAQQATQQAQAAADQAKTALATANSSLAQAQAATNGLTTPFDVDVTTIRPGTTDFVVNGNEVSCAGFTGNSCPTTATLGGHFIAEGTQLFFEWPNVAKIPLTTQDGLTYSGQAPTTDSAAFQCGGKPSPTSLTVTFSPTHYTVNPQDHSVVATAMVVTWIANSAKGGGCVASELAYKGFFKF